VARAAIPQVSAALDDPRAEVRVVGARAVALFAPDAHGAIADLVRLLGDPSEPVRVAALEALGEFGRTAAAAASAVADRVGRGATPEERASAASTLGGTGAGAPHLDVLLHALLHDVAAVQASAAFALAQALEDESEERRELVSRALHGLHRG
jgi:HEAT repeat protein